jgi:iron(III) transport system substrate-binding protein
MLLLLYNSARVKPADAPTKWQDLLDPKWKNRETVGHPGFSGVVGTWVVVMRDLYGWSFFEQLERNRPQIGRSVNDAATTLNSGERIVAMGTSGLGAVNAARGNPIGISMPTDGAVLIVSPSAVMANAPHPNAARLFMEFLVGPGHAAVMAQVARVPVRATPAGGGLPPDAKLLRPTVAQIVKGIPEVVEQWRDLFGN